MQALQGKKELSQLNTTSRLTRLFACFTYALCSLLALAVLLEAASWIGWSAYRRFRPTFPELRAASPVYIGQPWATDFWREEHARLRSHVAYVPFTVWAPPAWHGRYINNDESATGSWRRTILDTTCATKPKISIWMFGGSTLYGTGVPDWGTVPSYLARSLSRATPYCAVVSNFGAEGYVSNQEVLQLMQQLKTGQRPDLVVFYDGVNDAAAAGASPGLPRAHFDFDVIKRRVEAPLSDNLDLIRKSYSMQSARAALAFTHSRRPPSLPVKQVQDKSAATLNNYQANIRIAQAFSRIFGFDLYWFWQPSLYYGHKQAVLFEKQTLEFMNNTDNKEWSRVIRAVYQDAEYRADRNGDFTFLGNLFDSVKEPIYIDEAHLGPRGNELVAQSLAVYIEDHFKSGIILAHDQSQITNSKATTSGSIR